MLRTSTFLVAAFMLIANNVHAGVMERFENDQPIRTAVANEPPFGHIDEQGNLAGYSPTLLRTLLQRAGWEGELKARIVEFSAMVSALQTKRIDVVAAALLIRPERCSDVAYSEPTMQNPAALVVQEGNPLGLNDHADIRNHPEAKLGVTAGTINAAYARGAGLGEDQIEGYEVVNDLFLAVNTGRVDAASISSLHAHFAQKRWPESYKLEVVAPIYEAGGQPTTGYAALAAHPDATAFIETLNAQIEAFVGSDAYLDMAEPYGITESHVPDKTTREVCARN